LKEFTTFIEEQPAFYDYGSSDLNKLTFDNNVGTFSGTMTSKKSQVYSVEYDMVKEDGQWRVLHILVSPLTANSISEKNEPM
jgi:hypothetical protein